MRIHRDRKAYLSHLNYSVLLRDASRAPLHIRKKFGDFIAITEKSGPRLSTIYMKMPITDKDIPTLCHEIIHALQNIGDDYGMDIFKEREHLAYLFQYILNEFVGYKYA